MRLLASSLLVTTTKLSLAPSLFLVGLGLGLVLAIIQDFVQSAAPPGLTSDVAGFSRSVWYLGSALGTLVAGAVLIGVLIAKQVSDICMYLRNWWRVLRGGMRVG